MVETYPNQFAPCVPYTTRDKLPAEQNEREYNFVNKNTIENMLSKGELIEAFKYNCHDYGITVESIEKVSERGKFCLITLELEVIV